MSGPPSTNSYLRDAVMTATPEQLHLMLYDGAIKFALQGKDALLARDYEKSYNTLTRAQSIILEMLNGLRPEVSPELCDQMAAIYNFLYRKLIEASVQKDTSCIDDVVKILRYQRETWVMLMGKVARHQGDEQQTSASDMEPSGQDGVGGCLSIEG